MWNKTQVYFQGILQGLKDASGPLILGLALEILPCFNKNNELDLDKVTVSEKIDGTAIRLAIINNHYLLRAVICCGSLLTNNHYPLLSVIISF